MPSLNGDTDALEHASGVLLGGADGLVALGRAVTASGDACAQTPADAAFSDFATQLASVAQNVGESTTLLGTALKRAAAGYVQTETANQGSLNEHITVTTGGS
jgi:hypothetical protein